MKDRILPDHWQYRPDTWDWNIFDSVVVHNEYRIPELPKNSLVLDIGAHIGSFAWICKQKGAKCIYSWELCHSNFNLLKQNLAEMAVVEHGAMWGDSYSALYEPEEMTRVNTGGNAVLTEKGPNRVRVPTIGINEAIQKALAVTGCDKIALLKLDCEGSEFKILPAISSANLSCIQAICAEVHCGWEHQGTFYGRAALDLPLREFLTHWEASPEQEAAGLYKLWADRRGAAGLFGIANLQAS